MLRPKQRRGKVHVDMHEDFQTKGEAHAKVLRQGGTREAEPEAVTGQGGGLKVKTQAAQCAVPLGPQMGLWVRWEPQKVLSRDGTGPNCVEEHRRQWTGGGQR